MEQLDLSGCTTNKEVTDLIKNHVKDYNLKKLTSKLAEDFVFHEKATKKIYAALATGKNSVLYGPGGFGKSVLVKAICKELGIPVVYKIGYEGMTSEELLGIPNMKKLLEDSTYEVAFENSVFSKPGILILEEFFDASPSTAAALKDILTERGYREGSVKKESLIASVIITGNKTPDDMSIDDSAGAFYKDRFAMRHNMVWDEFRDANYLQFFKVYFKEKYNSNFNKFILLSKLCANTEEQVSPRVAAQAGEVMLELGVDFLDTVEGIDTNELVRYEKETREETKVYEERQVLDNADGYIKKIDLVTNTMQSVLDNQFKLDVLENRLKLFSFSETNVGVSLEIFGTIKRLREMNYESCRKFVNEQAILCAVDELITQ